MQRVIDSVWEDVGVTVRECGQHSFSDEQILRFEQEYSEMLKVLIECFIEPLYMHAHRLNANTQRKPTSPQKPQSEEINNMFPCIQELHNLHSLAILPAVQAAPQSTVLSFARAVTHNRDQFQEAYMYHISNFEDAFSATTEFCERLAVAQDDSANGSVRLKDVWNTVLTNATNSGRLKGKSLPRLLVMPIKQLIRYHKWLEQATKVNNDAMIAEAFRIVDDACEGIDNAFERSHETRFGREVQDRLKVAFGFGYVETNKFELTQRRFLGHGTFRRKPNGKGVEVSLFDNTPLMIVCLAGDTEADAPKILAFPPSDAHVLMLHNKNTIPTPTPTTANDDPNNSTVFRLVNSQSKLDITIECSTMSARDEWCELLWASGARGATTRQATAPIGIVSPARPQRASRKGLVRISRSVRSSDVLQNVPFSPLGAHVPLATNNETAPQVPQDSATSAQTPAQVEQQTSPRTEPLIPPAEDDTQLQAPIAAIPAWKKRQMEQASRIERELAVAAEQQKPPEVAPNNPPPQSQQTNNLDTPVMKLPAWKLRQLEQAQRIQAQLNAATAQNTQDSTSVGGNVGNSQHNISKSSNTAAASAIDPAEFEQVLDKLAIPMAQRPMMRQFDDTKKATMLKAAANLPSQPASPPGNITSPDQAKPSKPLRAGLDNASFESALDDLGIPQPQRPELRQLSANKKQQLMEQAASLNKGHEQAKNKKSKPQRMSINLARSLKPITRLLARSSSPQPPRHTASSASSTPTCSPTVLFPRASAQSFSHQNTGKQYQFPERSGHNDHQDHNDNRHNHGHSKTYNNNQHDHHNTNNNQNNHHNNNNHSNNSHSNHHNSNHSNHNHHNNTNHNSTNHNSTNHNSTNHNNTNHNTNHNSMPASQHQRLAQPHQRRSKRKQPQLSSSPEPLPTPPSEPDFPSTGLRSSKSSLTPVTVALATSILGSVDDEPYWPGLARSSPSMPVISHLGNKATTSLQGSPQTSSTTAAQLSSGNAPPVNSNSQDKPAEMRRASRSFSFLTQHDRRSLQQDVDLLRMRKEELRQLREMRQTQEKQRLGNNTDLT